MKNLKINKLLRFGSKVHIREFHANLHKAPNLYGFNLFTMLRGKLLKRGLKMKASKIITELILKLSNEFFTSRKLIILAIIAAFEELRPLIRLKNVRRSGILYQMPGFLTIKESYMLVLKWIFANIYTKARTNKISNYLFFEFVSILKKTSSLFRRKMEMYKIAIKARGFMKAYKRVRGRRRVGVFKRHIGGRKTLYKRLHSRREIFQRRARKRGKNFAHKIVLKKLKFLRAKSNTNY
jgi:ribosomal protein S7